MAKKVLWIQLSLEEVVQDGQLPEGTTVQVQLPIPPGVEERDILDALQRGVCSAYEALKRANFG